MGFLPEVNREGKLVFPSKKKRVKKRGSLRREQSVNKCAHCGGMLTWYIRTSIQEKQLRKKYYFTRWEKCHSCKSIFMHEEFKVDNGVVSSMKKKPLQPKDYSFYIRSRKWNKRRRRYFATNGNTCAICGSKEGLNLHHKTYQRLGMEEDADLVPLCKEHHDELHSLIGISKDMTLATDTFIEEKSAEINLSNIFRSF